MGCVVDDYDGFSTIVVDDECVGTDLCWAHQAPAWG